MRFLAAAALIFLVVVNVAQADAVFKVGVTMRNLIPAEPYDWRSAKTHALRAMVWYPAATAAREEPQWIGPPIVPFISAGSAARDVPPAAGPRRPLILLSHGSGGIASGLAWLGTALAAHGFIAVAVNHPGNNALEDYTVEGFSLWWLRAVDLSVVIGAVLDDKTFGSQIDPAHIGAAGHSLGGYTVIASNTGPSDEELRTGRSRFWGMASNAAGEHRTARLETANGYRLTADGTIMAVKFVLDDAPAGGYYTPSTLMGARCVEQLPGSTPIRVE